MWENQPVSFLNYDISNMAATQTVESNNNNNNNINNKTSLFQEGNHCAISHQRSH